MYNTLGIRRQALAAIVICIAIVSHNAKPAHADIERYPNTYQWFTSSKGEIEFGIGHEQSVRSSESGERVEVEYGVTDRYTVEAYLLENRNGSTWSSGGFKIENRYRFGNYGLRKAMWAAYAEYEEERGEKQHLETKAIMQYDPTPQTTISVNLFDEAPAFASHAEVLYGYAVGAAYMPNKSPFWFGVEALGKVTEKEQSIGPVVGVSIDDQTRIVGTYAVQFQGDSGNEVRVLLSHELR